MFHIHGTSGTTGRPTAFAIGRNDWRTIANAHARIMWGMGMRPGDTICVAAIFSLYMGSWGALAGAERLRREMLSVRRRRARHVGALRAMARHDQADGVLRHADLRAASCASRAGRRPQSARFPAQDHVLLRRARRVDSRRARQDRGHLRRESDRLRLDGGNVAVDERRGLGADRAACCAGRTWSTPRSAIRRPCARALRPARHAGLHASRAHFAADDPAGVRRPVALDRTNQIRAGALIRGCRRAFSGASTTCSRFAARTSIRARSMPRSTNCRLMAASIAS